MTKPKRATGTATPQCMPVVPYYDAEKAQAAAVGARVERNATERAIRRGVLRLQGAYPGDVRDAFTIVELLLASMQKQRAALRRSSEKSADARRKDVTSMWNILFKDCKPTNSKFWENQRLRHINAYEHVAGVMGCHARTVVRHVPKLKGMDVATFEALANAQLPTDDPDVAVYRAERARRAQRRGR